jgi:hypothetical protein
VVTCPGHGLRWNVKTGELVESDESEGHPAIRHQAIQGRRQGLQGHQALSIEGATQSVRGVSHGMRMASLRNRSSKSDFRGYL